MLDLCERTREGAEAMKKKIAVVGQVPPPWGGQTLMIANLLKGRYENAELIHVKVNFSSGLDELGRVSLRKLLEPFRVIARAIRVRFALSADVIYYAPSAPKVMPLYRDILILAALRPFFKKTIFHFHAAGIVRYARSKPLVVRALFNLAFRRPALCITLSKFNPDDAGGLGSERTVEVPNGIEDVPSQACQPVSTRRRRILFVGLITESKGVFELVEAVRLLKLHVPYEFEVRLVGEFASARVESKLKEFIFRSGLERCVVCTGRLVGEEKHREFDAASVLCYPSYFEAESFGLVVAEAMCKSLPVVAARWRGIQSLVIDGVSGFLVQPRDSRALFERLKIVLDDLQIAEKMGAAGRVQYERYYTLSSFYMNMDLAFGEVT